MLLPHKKQAILAYSVMHCCEGSSDKVYIPCLYIECHGDQPDPDDMGTRRLQFTASLSAFYGRASVFTAQSELYCNLALGMQALSETSKLHHAFSLPYAPGHNPPWSVDGMAFAVTRYLQNSSWHSEFESLCAAKRAKGYGIVSRLPSGWRISADAWFPQWNMTRDVNAGAAWSRGVRFIINDDLVDDALRVLAVIHEGRLQNPRAECIPVRKSQRLSAEVQREWIAANAHERRVLLPGETPAPVVAPKVLIEL